MPPMPVMDSDPKDDIAAMSMAAERRGRLAVVVGLQRQYEEASRMYDRVLGPPNPRAELATTDSAE